MNLHKNSHCLSAKTTHEESYFWLGNRSKSCHRKTLAFCMMRLFDGRQVENFQSTWKSRLLGEREQGDGWYPVEWKRLWFMISRNVMRRFTNVAVRWDEETSRYGVILAMPKWLQRKRTKLFCSEEARACWSDWRTTRLYRHVNTFSWNDLPVQNDLDRFYEVDKKICHLHIYI